MITTTPATNTAVVDADFVQVGTTKQATDLTLAGMTADDYQTWTLKSTGLGNIDKDRVI